MIKNKKFLLLTVLAVFSLVLTACGFGGDKSDNSSSSDGKKKILVQKLKNLT